MSYAFHLRCIFSPTFFSTKLLPKSFLLFSIFIQSLDCFMSGTKIIPQTSRDLSVFSIFKLLRFCPQSQKMSPTSDSFLTLSHFWE